MGLLGDVEFVTDDPAETEIARARVLEHTPDHEELWRRANKRPPESGAVLFIGEYPETDLALITSLFPVSTTLEGSLK